MLPQLLKTVKARKADLMRIKGEAADISTLSQEKRMFSRLYSERDACYEEIARLQSRNKAGVPAPDLFEALAPERAFTVTRKYVGRGRWWWWWWQW